MLNEGWEKDLGFGIIHNVLSGVKIVRMGWKKIENLTASVIFKNKQTKKDV